MVKQLLTTGRAAPVKGFVSKAGKEFTAGLRWDGEAAASCSCSTTRRPPPPPASRPPRHQRRAKVTRAPPVATA
jgi:hypothetical protein